MIKIAFSMHSSPGVYALLLGSGVSRGAGILTGWEVVLDLIEKVRAMKGESQVHDPEKWYIEKYRESPDYSKILDMLTNTPSERSKLLESYFEPTEAEREEGLKAPTEAHRSIATLVKHGYIRMILTTNFDRLIEKALEEEGVSTKTIAIDDAFKGALPYIHNECTIIKLHGDYKDTRIKNTSEELSKYSEELNEYLDRVLDEFGFIICGWSAEWDEALKEAFYRREKRRFSIFWATKGEPSDCAERLINHLQAESISIEDADQFFTELLEKVEDLRDMKSSDPLKVAIDTVKRYLSEEKYHIKLHDFVTDEVNRVCRELASDRFETENVPFDEDILKNRIHEYEELVRVLIGILSTLAYFDKGKHNELITESIDHLLRVSRVQGSVVLLELHYYPALLLIYSIGIISIKREKYDVLAAVLLESRYLKFNGKIEPTINLCHDMIVLFQRHYLYIQDVERGYPQMSQQVYNILREPLSYHLQSDVEYEEIFDIFEYLLGLFFVHTEYPDSEVQEKVDVLQGRFVSRYYGLLTYERGFSPIKHFVDNGLKEDKDWGLLRAGFFNCGPRRFKECHEAYEKELKEARRRW
ncbi:MAG: SIR2 family protein [Halobacteriota archaeon]|nr:SIR2 family protein [Halobacteriota archaeon]